MARYMIENDSESYRGFSVNVHHDSDCESPLSYDEAVRFVVLHNRYIDPSNGVCGSCPEAVLEWTADNQDEWFVLPLWLYDHSGTIYKPGAGNPFSCPWDSGQVGIIALRREDFGYKNESDYLEAAKRICDSYTSWANGSCYGYTVTDDGGDEIASCWGFIGMDADASGLWEYATNEIDCEISNRNRARVATLKRLIRNRVPLDLRGDILAT